mmetsp:Transcript_41621/g.114760  ORF Transcript_41621/g.114760 Transcript_41621/m.114760 type:complete len:244 (+) Transcript_41621:721-1452(+)
MLRLPKRVQQRTSRVLRECVWQCVPRAEAHQLPQQRSILGESAGNPGTVKETHCCQQDLAVAATKRVHSKRPVQRKLFEHGMHHVGAGTEDDTMHGDTRNTTLRSGVFDLESQIGEWRRCTSDSSWRMPRQLRPRRHLRFGLCWRRWRRPRAGPNDLLAAAQQHLQGGLSVSVPLVEQDDTVGGVRQYESYHPEIEAVRSNVDEILLVLVHRKARSLLVHENGSEKLRHGRHEIVAIEALMEE